MKVRKHEKSLADANAEALAAVKGQQGVDKQVTTFKGVAKDAGDGSGGIDTGPLEPNDQQLEQINQFTRSPKKASELVVFPTLSCNDLWDRDEEAFTTQTVKDFATLAAPYGPVGKAYMVSHDYTKLPVGRIFNAGTKRLAVDDSGTKATFLTNEVYIPNTLGNQKLIEDIDFGVSWAVSVGVMLEESICSLSWCGAQMRGFGRWAWCANGHDKGMWYDPNSEEKDSWGYYMPVEEGTKGAELARVYMKGAKDFYELSQCFLGAQFFAALEDRKGAEAKALIKAASARNLPIIGMSAKEATDLLEGSVVDPRVRHAVRDFGAKPDDEGTMRWTDDQKLVWTFDPDSGVSCLGKQEKEGEQDGESATGQSAEESRSEGAGEQSEAAGTSADGSVGEGAEDGGIGGTGEVQEGSGQDGDLDESKSSGHSHVHSHSDGTSHNHVHTHNGDNGYNHTTGENVTHTHTHNDSGKEATVSKTALVTALRGIGGVPESILQAVEAVSGDDLDAALQPLVDQLDELSKSVETLKPKAALGDEYVKAKRADAIHWYVVANQTTAQGGESVNTDSFERILAACGENVDLIDALIDQNRTTAQAKFPSATRRSSFPTDPHDKVGGGGSTTESDDDETESAGSRTASIVRNLHG